MVLHTHQANPHVHLAVRAEGRDGQRLNPRKQDLRRWREVFAEKLRGWGIEAEASSQVTRGSRHRTERLWQRKAYDDGRGGRRGGFADAKLTPSRRHAAQAWCEIAKALASSDDLADRELGRSVVNYARWLPGVRYKPPEKQPQRELPGLERTSMQKTRPEPGWGALTRARRTTSLAHSMRLTVVAVTPAVRSSGARATPCRLCSARRGRAGWSRGRKPCHATLDDC